MNLNEECLLHYLGHFKNQPQAPRPLPAGQSPSPHLSELARLKAENPREARTPRRIF